MILDLLTTDTMGSFNIVLANKIGLHPSIYINELLNINKKALSKQKMFDDGYFKVNRGYVTSKTTIDSKEQRGIDKILQVLGIIEINKDSDDLLKLDLDALTGILLEDREEINKKVKQLSQPSKKTKKEGIIEALKEHIHTDNEELRTAYCDWIDAVMTKMNWMSAASVEEAQLKINTEAHRDLDIALEIVKIATINGYRDVDWAIKVYRDKKNGRTYGRNFTTGLNTNPNTNNPDTPPSEIKFSDKKVY